MTDNPEDKANKTRAKRPPKVWQRDWNLTLDDSRLQVFDFVNHQANRTPYLTLGKSTWLEMVRNGTAPASIKQGSTVTWSFKDVREWKEATSPEGLRKALYALDLKDGVLLEDVLSVAAFALFQELDESEGIDKVRFEPAPLGGTTFTIWPKSKSPTAKPLKLWVARRLIETTKAIDGY
jgi:hypothetical protein